jgi:hypothetical protein
MPNHHDKHFRPGLGAALGAIAVLILCVLAAIHSVQPPAPRDAQAPLGRFAAGRALAHLASIAREPHPVGTVQNAGVRAYLLKSLNELGLEPHVQTAWSLSGETRSAALVGNVVARLPGRQRGKALLLVAHYDSVPTAPGAADDGASVAAILETVRALKTAPPLDNDVIVLFTDGEESGLLGSRAFVREHAWLSQVGLVLNFEFRGNSGPVWMFETSAGNGKLIDGFARAPQALGNSLMADVYRHMPNGTDLTVFMDAGLAGMNFAAAENHTSYHTRLDSIEHLSLRTLQQQGDTMLALVRHFGMRKLERLDGGDRIYFNLAGAALVSYPAALAWPLWGVCLALAFLAVRAALGSGAARGRRMAGAMAAQVLTLALLAVGGQLLWSGILLLHPQYRMILQGDTYNSHWYLPAFVALGVAGYGLAMAGLRRWFSTAELELGAVLFWVAALGAACWFVPGASFLLTWPLIAALLAQAWLLRRPGAGAGRRLVLLTLAAVPAVLIVAPIVHLVYTALTPSFMAATLVVLGLLLGLSTPLLFLLTRPFALPALPLALAIGLLGCGAATAGFDRDHPAPNSLFYFKEGSSGQAWWVSTDRAPDAWTRRVLADQPLWQTLPELYGPASRRVWTGKAPDLGLPSPTIEVLEDRVEADARHVRVQIKSQRQASSIVVSVDGATVEAATVAGHAYLDKPAPNWWVSVFGVAEPGVTVALTLKAGTPFQLRVKDVTYGLPKAGLPPESDNRLRMAQPFGLGDTLQAARVLSFK